MANNGYSNDKIRKFHFILLDKLTREGEQNGQNKTLCDKVRTYALHRKLEAHSMKIVK